MFKTQERIDCFFSTILAAIPGHYEIFSNYYCLYSIAIYLSLAPETDASWILNPHLFFQLFMERYRKT